MTFERLMCCGIKEINGLSDYPTSKKALLAMIREELEAEDIKYHYCEEGIDEGHLDDRHFLKFGAILFTGVVKFRESVKTPTYAERFARYIRRQGLGKVVKVPSFLNHNTGNTIDARVWLIDREALRSWAKAHIKDLNS